MCATAVLLNTKLAGPRLGPQVVPRPRLFKQLHRALDVPFTLLSAPAGFGKSTLVAGWLAHSLDAPASPTSIPARADPDGWSPPERAGFIAAWLTVDEFDNDPPHFWSYMLAALEVAHAVPPGLQSWAASMQRALASTNPPMLDGMVAGLLNELAQLSTPLILVLDDYQQITAPAVHDRLHYFLTHLPPHVHLIILSRADPPLPLNRLRAQGHMLELRSLDLCFTQDEIGALLGRRLRLALPPEAVAALAAHTDGWPTGVQLFALSVQGRTAAEVQGFIHSFTGSNRYIVDYLLEEVLERQPQPVREFLLRTSLLDRFTADLCDELRRVGRGETGEPVLFDPSPKSREILHYLETTNLFVVSLDDHRVWYRYYHLFAEALQEELRRRSPQLVPLLHRRAGAWCAENQMHREAVEHMMAAAEWEGAADLLIHIAQPLLIAGDFNPLNRWLDALPLSAVAARPRLAITRGWLLLFRGPLERVEGHIEEAAAMLAQAPALQRRETRAMHGELATLRAMLASFRWDVQATFALCAEADRLVPEGDDFLHAALNQALGHAYQLRGDFNAAVATYVRSIVFCDRLGSPQLAAFPTFRLAQTYQWQGRLTAAADAFRNGLKSALEHGGAHWPVTADAYIGLAGIALERNELAAADSYVQRGLVLAPHRSVDILVSGLATQAAIRLAAGRGDDARHLVQQAVHHASEYHNVRLLAWATAALARVDIALGHIEAAVQWAEMVGGRNADDEFLVEQEVITTARLYLAQGRPRAALALLLQQEARASARDRRRSLVEILALQAAAQGALRLETAAAQALDQALALAEPEGMRRVFLGEGGRLLPLLQKAAGRSPFARELAGLLEDGNPAQATLLLDAPLDRLTPRELEILRLIARGASNRQIAETFVLTVGTVKGHVNHILSKLGAQNRTEAAARARDLGLL